MSSLDLFINFFKEYYSHEFDWVEKKEKDYWIEKVLKNNSEYITKEEVMNFDGCIQCGNCCKSQHCPDWDSETKLCTRHDNPIHRFCKEYPWGGEYGIAPLTLNCRYQISFFIMFFDNFFRGVFDAQ